MPSTSLDVVIIGGGIGGLCLAQGLKAANISVAVYERNPHPTDWLQGYRIHINPVGCRALHECIPSALWEVFVATAGKPPAGLGFLTERMEELVVIGEAFMSEGPNDAVDTHRPTSRIALRHLLLSGMEDIIRFGKTFERYERTPEGKVTAFFSDGTTATGDVLIGADGANSRVCKQYLPQARRFEVSAMGVGGKLILTNQSRAWVPQQLLTRMNLCMAPTRYTVFSAAFDHVHASNEPLDGVSKQAQAAGLDPALLFHGAEDYLLWAFIAPSSAYPTDAQSFDGSALQRFILKTMKGWHPDLRRLIAEADPEDVSLVPFKASIPIEAWETTNITLLGDAIHNMPPVGGLGANMALRDASLLCRKLAAVSHGQTPLLQALHEYEEEMRKYGFNAVQVAIENTKQAVSKNRFAREAAKMWFRLCNKMPSFKRKFEDRWSEPMRI
jgi:2-polyprenyl-6-methoxyphenol hydroxylase-like FAD-dependent oxidoreductase